MTVKLQENFTIERKGMRLKIVDDKIVIGPMTREAPSHPFYPYQASDWTAHRDWIAEYFGIEIQGTWRLEARVLPYDRSLAAAIFSPAD